VLIPVWGPVDVPYMMLSVLEERKKRKGEDRGEEEA
jgi:hypothetical protein